MADPTATPTKAPKPAKAEAGKAPSSPTSSAQLPPKPTAGKFEEIGVSGLRAYSGIVDEEFLTELKGEKGRKIYREMAANDATVGAMLFAIGLMIRGVKWRSVPKDEEDEK